MDKKVIHSYLYYLLLRVLDFVTKEEINSGRLIKIKYMSFDEEDEIEGFKIGGDEEDEPLDMPEMDFGLDEEDPDKDR